MIRYWNAALNQEEVEKVYGEAWVQRLYGNGLGRWFAHAFLASPAFSRIYGGRQDSPSSQKKIAPFIRDYGIPMDQFEDPGFRSFNDFFIRKFKPGLRKFPTQTSQMGAFAEARYLGYEKTEPTQKIPVKGEFLSPEFLLGDSKLAAQFKQGPLLIARLCPTDYHRYHYPDSGRTRSAWQIPGKYHSVNPLALRARGEIFGTNERRVSILETENFGTLAYIEVGAMGVGKIVQTHDESLPFQRGEEKGYFLFGASTVIVLGEPGKWKPAPIILDRTLNYAQECLFQLGAGVGVNSSFPL